MEIIVLSSTKYKEKDSIINAISKDGPVSFRARGSLDPKHAMTWINNVLTVADVELLEGKYKYPILNSASLISSSITGSDSLEYLFAISALAEITKDALLDEDKHRVYDHLIEATRALRKNKDPLMVNLLYLAKCIAIGGAEPNVDGCVYSGKTTDIVAFSFDDGGFVSRDYINENIALDLSPNQLKLIRYCFKAPDFSCVQSDKYSKEDKNKVLDKFVDFIDHNIGAKITATDYLKNN